MMMQTVALENMAALEYLSIQNSNISFIDLRNLMTLKQIEYGLGQVAVINQSVVIYFNDRLVPSMPEQYSIYKNIY